jgi:hypothetical protein
MKTQSLLAILLLAGTAVAFAPTAAAQDLCQSNPTYGNEVCCKAPSNPTTQFYCTVRGGANTYIVYLEGVALGAVASVLALEDCLVNQHPIGQWLQYCIVIN